MIAPRPYIRWTSGVWTMMQHTHRRRSSGAAGPISKAAFKPERQAGSPPPRIVFGSQCLSAEISFCLMMLMYSLRLRSLCDAA